MKEQDLLHEEHLPFSKADIKNHFIESELGSLDKHLNYYENSIKLYKKYEDNNISKVDKIEKVRQVEKDERFWTIKYLLRLYKSDNFKRKLTRILKETYGDTPPLSEFKNKNWDNCLEGNEGLKLYFEPNLPSPKLYKKWLKENLEIVNLKDISFKRDKARNAKKGEYRDDLEGPTNVDAIILNPSNGFSIFVEAKVLSDISCDTTYNLIRNQIIRNIDVMLDDNREFRNCKNPLKALNSKNSLFLLLTPKVFKDKPWTRFYGYKFIDYVNNPCSIHQELAHREFNVEKLLQVSKRLGWITWEYLKEITNESYHNLQ